MTERKPKVLVVDDEIFNLDILQNDLEEAGFEIVRAEDGVIALAKINEHPDIDVVVLDRMMPNMDGMEVTRTLKKDPKRKDIPIIMQTAAGQSQQVKEGLAAGVFYYLIKPYNESLLVSIVNSALQRDTAAAAIKQKVEADKKLFGLVDNAKFRFRTLQDVSKVAYYVASCFPQPDSVVYGLCELMINAVEHGNLGIDYTEKMDLVMKNVWQQEVERRLNLPENKSKFAILNYTLNAGDITITIKDQGKGFKWEPYLDFDPMRMASDPNGKGIAIAKVVSFPYLEYRAGGTEVVCRVPV